MAVHADLLTVVNIVESTYLFNNNYLVLLVLLENNCIVVHCTWVVMSQHELEFIKIKLATFLYKSLFHHTMVDKNEKYRKKRT